MRSGNKFFSRLIVFISLSATSLWCSAELTVTNAWVTLAPPSSQVNAAYVKFTNTQKQSQVITHISADCCAMTMLHETRQDQGKASMNHLEQLTIPAKSTVELKPGGIHIMLMKPVKPLALNDTVNLTLTFSDGSQQKMPALVKRDVH
jgi:periplasmic copper chaperone A